ncbi:hypothetical protein [Sphingobacterium multivorum]|uniref:hypothetical protein n=1 Tax=Sphingobacterium multivorum TaxID=28454 RepID=UPI0028AA0BEE|nr:hypothetical protein [Sphingobacterium multivorum]
MEIRNLNGAEMSAKVLLSKLKLARENASDGETKRLLSISITDLEKSLWAIEKANKNEPKLEWVNPEVQRFA